jgi:hypothetical protein
MIKEESDPETGRSLNSLRCSARESARGSPAS